MFERSDSDLQSKNKVPNLILQPADGNKSIEMVTPSNNFNSQAKLLIDESARLSQGLSRINDTGDLLNILEDNLNTRMSKP